jgi:tetratricopeptide (TPR) repeat protein
VTWFLDRVGPWRPPDGAWASEVGLELANLRSLVLLVAPVDPERAQQLACVVGRYDDVAQRFRAGIEDLARYVDELGAPTPSRVALLTALGDLYLRIGQVDPARRLAAEADALRKEVGPPPWDDAGVERTSGEVAIRTLDLARATAIAEEALARPLSPRGRSRMWNLRGIASYRTGDLEGAAAAFDAELAALVELGHEVFVASAHGNCAEIAMQRGRVAEAAAHQLACLEPALALGQPVQLAFSLIVAARLAATQARWPIATRLQAKADAILGEVGHVLYEDDRRLSDQLLADARAKLGPSTFDQERARGLALDPSAAGELAAEVLRAVSAPSRV